MSDNKKWPSAAEVTSVILAELEPASPPAMNVASPTEPIPAGVYYSKQHGNFYDMGDEYGMGELFFGKWYDRRAEFPGESSVSYAAPVGQGSVTSGEAVEAAAKAIYRLFDGADEHPWREGGNSFKQDEARRYARAALAAKAEQSNSAGGAPYRVAEFWSSSQPGTKVRMLAEGDDIEQWGKRGDFIRWVDAPVAERAATPPSVPEGWSIKRREDGRIAVVKEGYGGAYVQDDPGMVNAETTLYFLAEDYLATFAAPEVAQPAAQGESIETTEFCDLITELHSAHEEVNPENSKKAWAALINHINAWGKSLATPASTADNKPGE